MSASEGKKAQSLHLDLSNLHHETAPPVAALFLITFDVKAGYTIAWQRSISDVKLDQSVEYRSLPSGLHNIQEDLIYFTHDDEYVGVSAYVNKPSQNAERNSLMVAVGVLLPSQGQLGRAWLHAEALRGLTRGAFKDLDNTEPLEKYWERYRLGGNDATEVVANGSPSTAKSRPQSAPDAGARTRQRAVSTASALARPGHHLSPDHPVQSLNAFLDTFGPLIFPIYKLALLRRRILFATSAPVETPCKFVYDTSLISGIPNSISEDIPLEPLPSRLFPLFSVGLHDIDTLSQGARSSNPSNDEGYGWVACTTDEIIRQKTDLYDYIIKLPPPHARDAERRIWPEIFDSEGNEIKATQRDLRRYRVLKQELRRFHALPSPNLTLTDPAGSLTALNQESLETDTSSTHDANLTEKKSVMAVVYEGFMWWAAAGEKRTDLDEEEQQDAALMRSLDDEGTPGRPRSSGRSPAGMQLMVEEHGPAALEIAVVAFFHHLTTQIFRTLALVIQDADVVDDDADEAAASDDAGSIAAVSTDSVPLIPAEDAEKKAAVVVEAEDMARMGLDLWSESDRSFVEELVALYWGRKAEVARSPGIECCGVRIY